MTNELAFSIDQKIKELRRETVIKFWELVETLRDGRQRKLWETMGYDSWGEYLAQPEIGMVAATVDNYITALNSGEKHPRFRELSRTRAILIAPHLDDKNADELISKARELSWSDLRTEVSLLDGGKEPEETGRPAKPNFFWCEQHQRWGLSNLWRGKICWH